MTDLTWPMRYTRINDGNGCACHRLTFATATRNLLLHALSHALPARGVRRLQLQQRPQEAVRGDGQTLQLGVGVEAVEGGVLRGEVLVDVAVIARIVGEGRGQKSRAQVELPLQLQENI